MCIAILNIWATSWDYGTYHTDDQRRLRWACASALSRQSLICPTKNHTSSPTGWLRMRVWRMGLRRPKRAIISWHGSFACFIAMKLLLAAFLLYLVEETKGHGRLISPAGRSTMWRYGFNTPHNTQDNQLSCGGFGVIISLLCHFFFPFCFIWNYAPISVFPQKSVCVCVWGDTLGIRQPNKSSPRNLTDDFGTEVGPQLENLEEISPTFEGPSRDFWQKIVSHG